MPELRACLIREAGGRVFGERFQLRHQRRDQRRKRFAAPVVNGRDRGGGLSREHGAQIAAEIRREFQFLIETVRACRVAIFRRNKAQPKHFILIGHLAPDQHIAVHLVEPVPPLLLSGFQGGASFATADGEHFRVRNDVKAGLTLKRELLFQLGNDMPCLPLVLIAFEFRDKEGELLAIGRASFPLRFSLRPPTPAASNKKHHNAADGGRDNTLKNCGPRQIHGRPELKRKMAGSITFLGKKRGLCFAPLVIDGTMPDKARAHSGT